MASSRRDALRSLGAAVGFGIAGCAGRDGRGASDEPDSMTTTSPDTPTTEPTTDTTSPTAAAAEAVYVESYRHLDAIGADGDLLWEYTPGR